MNQTVSEELAALVNEDLAAIEQAIANGEAELVIPPNFYLQVVASILDPLASVQRQEVAAAIPDISRRESFLSQHRELLMHFESQLASMPGVEEEPGRLERLRHVFASAKDLKSGS